VKSAVGPVDSNKAFAQQEIEETFRHYWHLGGAGKRWAESSDLYTIYGWHTIEGNTVTNGMINRLDDREPGGAPPEFFGVTIQVYAGDGLWSYQEDYSSMGMMRVRSEYDQLCKIHDPDHPTRRTRNVWPAGPAWAVGLKKNPLGI